MQQAFFWCYPWDIDAASLGRMAGDIGVDAISVAATTQRVAALSPRTADGPHTVIQESAAHFRPSADRYAATRLRLATAKWMKSRNALEQIAHAAEKAGLALRVWATCCQSDTLARQHPMAQCVDVFGDAIAGRIYSGTSEIQKNIIARHMGL